MPILIEYFDKTTFHVMYLQNCSRDAELVLEKLKYCYKKTIHNEFTESPSEHVPDQGVLRSCHVGRRTAGGADIYRLPWRDGHALCAAHDTEVVFSCCHAALSSRV